MSDRFKSILFAVVLCTVISLLLTAASTGLKPFQEKNMRLDRQKNILKSVGLLDDIRTYAAEDVERLYAENIRALWTDASGRILEQPVGGETDLPIYLYLQAGGIQSFIVPINSRGLWGRIMGYLAIQGDGSTIAGFTVYKHSETPGLGGEIEKSWFQKNFVGKKIVNQGGEFVSIAVVKGKVSEKIPKDQQVNFVDGISGATLTGKYLTEGLRQNLYHYEPVSIRFRQNTVRHYPENQ